jgi:glutathione reductase (NADPH)
VPDFDWATLRDNKKQEISRLNETYRDLLSGVDADIIDGRAAIIDAHTVAVNGRQYSVDKILISTGGWPRRDTTPGAELGVTSNEIFDLEDFPKRIVVVGGGYIAVEFAGIFNGLGSQVTQLYRGPLFLRGFDQDIREHAAREIAQSGVDLRFNVVVESIEQTSSGMLCQLSDGSSIEADQVLYAIGREAHLEGLGLENVEVALNNNGTIKVDAEFCTSEPSIYAVGDVIGGMELTPVALAEGMAFARKQFGPKDMPVGYDFIPSAVFCQPNIGTVGFTEEAAREEFGDITLYKSTFRPMKYTLSGRNEKTFMKLIVDTASDRVVGVHMMGPDAGEIIQGIAIAMKAGATKAIFDDTIGIHPTAAEEFVTMREPWTAS